MILQERKFIHSVRMKEADCQIRRVILKKAGVDMTTSTPLQATIDRFNELLEMLEKEI